MELLTELALLVQEGFYTSIVCMFLFWLLPIQKIQKEWILEVAMRLTIVFVAGLMVWLSTGIPFYEWTRGIWKEAAIALAFSSLFYEFAGKFLVRKWFRNYKLVK